jgi:hypothetical protein
VATQKDVRRIALSLPGAEQVRGRFAFAVPNKGKLKAFVWVWMERVTPKKPRVANFDVIAVRVASLDERDRLLAADSVPRRARAAGGRARGRSQSAPRRGVAMSGAGGSHAREATASKPMTAAGDYLALLDWRRRVAEMYGEVRTRLGRDPIDALVLEFNFAYNPSCAYDPKWACPLAPQANRLPAAIEAGERCPPHFLGLHQAMHLAMHPGQIRTIRNLHRTTRGEPARFFPENSTYPSLRS